MNERSKIIWAAGFLDGEGCFFIRGGRPGQYQCGITANQVRPKPLEILRDLFGGTVRQAAYGTKNHKDFWDWRITAVGSIVKCIDKVHPYLVVKQDQAEILSEYCSLVLTNAQDRRNGMSDEQRSERDRLMRAIRACRM